jgi:hypothetical protein
LIAGALILLVVQHLTAASTTEIFLSTCSAGLTEPERFRSTIARMGYRPVEERGRAVLYRSVGLELLYTPNESCQLRGWIDPQEDANRVVGAVSSALGLPSPTRIEGNPFGWTRYRWPVQEGARPRFYLAARTMTSHQLGEELELSIHRGPAE